MHEEKLILKSGEISRSQESLLDRNIRQTLEQSISSFESDVDANYSISDSFRLGLEKVTSRIAYLAPTLKAGIDELRDHILTYDGTDKRQFCESASTMITRFLLDKFTIDEIELLSRKNKLMLNSLVEYVIDDEVVNIHIPLTFVRGLELKPKFSEAMVILANMCKSHPDFINVKTVKADSWLIYRLSDEVLQRFGFTKISRNDKTQTGTAEIPKEVLLERFS